MKTQCKKVFFSMMLGLVLMLGVSEAMAFRELEDYTPPTNASPGAVIDDMTAVKPVK